MLVAPRIVNNVSYVTKINHEKASATAFGGFICIWGFQVW